MADDRNPADPTTPGSNAAPDPASAPPPPLPANEPGGLFGKIKDAYRRWNDRRDLQRQLATLMDELEQTRERHAAVYAALGSDLVANDLLGHPDLAELPAARVVYDLQSKIAGHRSEIEQLQVARTAEEELLREWVAAWNQRLDADEQVLRSAEADRDAAVAEHAEADRAVREMLRGRTEAMRSLGARLTQAAQQVESVPESTSLQQMDDLAHATSQLASLLHDPMHGLPAAIERLLASRPRLADAESRVRAGTSAVAARRAEATAKEREAQLAADARHRETQSLVQKIAAIEQQIPLEHAALGRQAADRLARQQAPLDLPTAGPALAAIADESQQQQRISEMSRLIESMV